MLNTNQISIPQIQITEASYQITPSTIGLKNKPIYPPINNYVVSNNSPVSSPNISSNTILFNRHTQRVDNSQIQNTPRFQQQQFFTSRQPICKFCKKSGYPLQIKKYGKTAFFYTICLLLTTLIFFWLPFYMDSCKDIDYMCCNCGVVVATKKVSCI